MAKILFGADENDLYVAYYTFIDVLRDDAGHEVLKTSDADEVVEAMVKENVDLVIVEGRMRWGSLGKERTCVGQVSGYVAVQEARKQGSIIPAIFLETAWRPPEVENTKVLHVPSRLSDFLATVERMLG